MADHSPSTDDLHRLPTDEDLGRLQWTTVLYYLHETNPDNGLVRDKTDPKAPVSIAAVGMALATIPVIVERGVVIRKFAAKIARRRLRNLLDLPQGPEPDAAGSLHVVRGQRKRRAVSSKDHSTLRHRESDTNTNRDPNANTDAHACGSNGPHGYRSVIESN